MANWKAGTTAHQKMMATMKRWKKQGMSEDQVERWARSIEREFNFSGRNEAEQQERVQNWLEMYRRVKV